MTSTTSAVGIWVDPVTEHKGCFETTSPVMVKHAVRMLRRDVVNKVNNAYELERPYEPNDMVVTHYPENALPNSSIHESAKNGLVVLVRPPPHQRRRTENRLKNLQKCEKEINGLLNFIEDEEEDEDEESDSEDGSVYGLISLFKGLRKDMEDQKAATAQLKVEMAEEKKNHKEEAKRLNSKLNIEKKEREEEAKRLNSKLNIEKKEREEEAKRLNSKLNIEKKEREEEVKRLKKEREEEAERLNSKLNIEKKEREEEVKRLKKEREEEAKRLNSKLNIEKKEREEEAERLNSKFNICEEEAERLKSKLNIEKKEREEEAAWLKAALGKATKDNQATKAEWEGRFKNAEAHWAKERADLQQQISDLNDGMKDASDWIANGDLQALDRIRLRNLLDKAQAVLAFASGQVTCFTDPTASRAWRDALEGRDNQERLRSAEALLAKTSDPAVQKFMSSSGLCLISTRNSPIRKDGDGEAHGCIDREVYRNCIERQPMESQTALSDLLTLVIAFTLNKPGKMIRN